jgi:hypothetical protein
MIHGSCLCGAIRFEFIKPAGPFELCHYEAPILRVPPAYRVSF